jgi:hypothetical protein
MDPITASLLADLRRRDLHARGAAERRAAAARRATTAPSPVASAVDQPAPTAALPALLTAWNRWQDLRAGDASLADRLAARACLDDVRAGVAC